MKTLDCLKIIEQRIDPSTLKKELFVANGGPLVHEEYITPLKHPPVLLTKIYNEFRFLENGKVPEDADAILIGQNILSIGGTPREIYPASYYKTNGVPLRGLLKDSDFPRRK